MKLFKIFILLVVVFSQFSCKNYYESLLLSNDVDLKYKAAMEYFKNRKYRKAVELFDNLGLAVQGTPQEDTVNFYHGLSNYQYGDYQTAEVSLARFIEVFPRSPFIEQARFLRIKCLFNGTYRYELDQTPTKKAMSVMSEFMYDNPQSEFYPACEQMMKELMERLEKKSFESAKIYYIMEDYKTAHYALKNVLKENAENQYREDILYYTAMSAYKYALNSVHQKQKERYLNFVDDYYNFISEFPESKYKDELDSNFEKVKHYAVKTDDNKQNN